MLLCISKMQRLLSLILLSLLPLHAVAAEPPIEEPDTMLHIGSVEVTSIKQGTTLRGKAIAATLIDALMAERNHISALKDASEIVPNFYIPDYGSRMTTSVKERPYFFAASAYSCIKAVSPSSSSKNAQRFSSCASSHE